MHYDRRQIARSANNLARIYRNKRRDWDPVMFCPRETPLPPPPMSVCLRDGFRLAWKLAKREAQA